MIIEIPNDNSVVRWKKNDNEKWKYAEISDLIQAYEDRPKGKWIETSDFDEFYGKVYKCNRCNKETLGCGCHNYCPNCGADMQKGGAK